MTLGSTGDPDRALRQARRAFVRAAHPDRGGDPAQFAAGLARWDALLVDSPHCGGLPVEPLAASPVVIVLRRRRLADRLGRLVWSRHPRRRPSRVH